MSNQQNDMFQITSPNDWMNKVGVSISQGMMHLPMPFLNVPITEASKSIDAYRRSDGWEDKMREVKLIALNVRQAETMYFATFSNQIKANNPPSALAPQFPCYSCFLATVSPNSLREHYARKMVDLREQANKEVIHATENGIVFTLNFKLVEEYYDALLELELFYFPENSFLPIKFCKKHKIERKNKNG